MHTRRKPAGDMPGGETNFAHSVKLFQRVNSKETGSLPATGEQMASLPATLLYQYFSKNKRMLTYWQIQYTTNLYRLQV